MNCSEWSNICQVCGKPATRHPVSGNYCASCNDKILQKAFSEQKPVKAKHEQLIETEHIIDNRFGTITEKRYDNKYKVYL